MVIIRAECIDLVSSPDVSVASTAVGSRASSVPSTAVPSRASSPQPLPESFQTPDLVRKRSSAMGREVSEESCSPPKRSRLAPSDDESITPVASIFFCNSNIHVLTFLGLSYHQFAL